MPIMHVQTDSKVPMLKKSNIPVNDMNRRYTWYLYRGSIEKAIQTKVMPSQLLWQCIYALGCIMYNRWYDKVMRRQEPNYMYNNRSVTVVGDEITMQHMYKDNSFAFIATTSTNTFKLLCLSDNDCKY